MQCGKKLKRSLQRSTGIAKYIVRLLERSRWRNLQTEITIHRVFKFQNMSAPMRIRDCKQREHQYRDEHDECDDRENTDPYDPHEVNKWAHYFCLPIEVNNSVFQRALTVKIATFKIHVDVFSATTRAHRPVIIHKPNRLPAIVARHSFFHHVKAHAPTMSLGYCTVSCVAYPTKLENRTP